MDLAPLRAAARHAESFLESLPTRPVHAPTTPAAIRAALGGPLPDSGIAAERVVDDLVRAVGRWSGHPRPVLPLPRALGRLQALAMECLPGPPLMSRDNLDSMSVPNVAGGALPGLGSLGIAPAAVGTITPGFLGGTDDRRRLEPLRASARRPAR